MEALEIINALHRATKGSAWRDKLSLCGIRLQCRGNCRRSFTGSLSKKSRVSVKYFILSGVSVGRKAGIKVSDLFP